MSAVILDNGSSLMKVGFASDDKPKYIPSIVGRTDNIQNCYFGDDANAKRGIMRIRYPIENGIITNWDDMTQLWDHIFYNVLRIEPEEQSVFLTEAPLNPKANREKMVNIIFEYFNVPKCYLSLSPLLALYASGRTTGFVMDSGYNVTCGVQIYEGYCLPHAITRTNLGGKDVTEYFIELLNKKGHKFTREIVKNIKEELCDITLVNDDVEEKEYKLPDDNIINIGIERFKCSEILFNPKLFDIEQDGIHKIFYKSIIESDFEIRKDLFENIVLCGGNTMFNGINQRLMKEWNKFG
eukprot:73799_1